MIIAMALHANVCPLFATPILDGFFASRFHVEGPANRSALLIHLFELLELGGAQ